MRYALVVCGLLRSLAGECSGGQGLHLMAESRHLGGQGLQCGVTGRGRGMSCLIRW